LERDNVARVAAVSSRELGRYAGCVPALRAVQLQALRMAAAAVVEEPDDLVDRIGRHPAIRGELAAVDRDDAAGRHLHRMAARQVGRPFAARRADERSQARPRAEHVGTGDLRGDRVVDGPQEVFDVVGGDLWVVEGSVVVGIGRADVGEGVVAALAAPRHDEHRPAVLGNRHDDGDLVAHERPRHRQMDPFGRADGSRVRALVERAHVVGPDPRRVDDGLGRDLDLVTICSGAGSDDVPTSVLHEPGERHVVGEHGAQIRGRARDRERQARVVGLRVVVHV
jgi:hypothetical protein